MKRPVDLPPTVARAFVKDMEAYFAEKDPVKKDQIAVIQLRKLQDHWRPKLSLNDVKRMFAEMREHLRDK